MIEIVVILRLDAGFNTTKNSPTKMPFKNASSTGSLPKVKSLVASKLSLVDDDELYDEDQLYAQESSRLAKKIEGTSRNTVAEDDEFDF